MDKIEKNLKKLGDKEKEVLKNVLDKIKRGDYKNLDIKKLKNHDNVFRVRKSSLRIIYQIKNEEELILAIERRSDNTYNF